MTKSKANYVIGIDLGTSNCTMAYVPIKSDENGVIQQSQVRQMLAEGSAGEEFSLPSSLYFLLDSEKDLASFQLEDERTFSYTVGKLARDRGAELPGQVISSAKSWLCHDGINRRDAILPVEGESEKMSPVSACAAFLTRLKNNWNLEHSDAPFEDQKVLVTVPASFDPAARQLIQEACQLAGIKEPVLLEEPQAAFYSWLNQHEDSWRKELSLGDCVLVVDIGGGTTDFSLIEVKEEEGNLVLERLAVGAHLLLGGDNMDLALAHKVKQQLEAGGHAIDSWQLSSLVHKAREAKESLLSEDAPDTLELTIQGRGSRLIGGSLKSELTREDVIQFVVDGFFPMIETTDYAKTSKKAGLRHLGLPYVQDPRISSHLAKFLSRTGESESISTDDFVMPSHILFNGGVMKSSALENRVLDLLNTWAKALKKEAPKVLEGGSRDFAVSCGAAYYGKAREGDAIRIKSGTSRSYYIGIEEAVPAIPGIEIPMKALCVVPFGMEEGTSLELKDQNFSLLTGESVRFRFFSRSTEKLSDGVIPEAGMMLSSWKTELEELHPVENILDQQNGEDKLVRISLKSVVSELGVLELWCVAEDGRQWKLEFDIREESSKVRELTSV